MRGSEGRSGTATCRDGEGRWGGVVENQAAALQPAPVLQNDLNRRQLDSVSEHQKDRELSIAFLEKLCTELHQWIYSQRVIARYSISGLLFSCSIWS